MPCRSTGVCRLPASQHPRRTWLAHNMICGLLQSRVTRWQGCLTGGDGVEEGWLPRGMPDMHLLFLLLSRRSCDIPYPGTKYSKVYNPSLLLVRPQSHLDFTSLRESICVTDLGQLNISLSISLARNKTRCSAPRVWPVLWQTWREAPSLSSEISSHFMPPSCWHVHPMFSI